MLDEFKDRIQHAKDKQFYLMQRFHIGDTVYPFWLNNFIVYGTVIDIDTVARKIICDFNGIARQFCPQDLMLVNPELSRIKRASVNKDADNGIKCKCKDCGGQIAVSYNEQTAKTDFVCTSCGKRIPEDKLSSKCKKAMRNACIKSINASLSQQEIEDAVYYIEDKIKSIEAAVEKIKGGSDMEKGYLLEKISKLQDYVKRYL